MQLSAEEVKHIAWLARLGLTEEEVETFRSQLSHILENFQILQEVDTTSVPAVSHASGLENVLREDEPRDSLPQSSVLANAPDRADNCFRVGAIIE